MENDSKLQQWFSSATDWLNEQEWFQQIRGKWDELDAQSRFYAKIGMTAGAAGALAFVLVGTWISVRSLKNEVLEKQELMTMIQNSFDELRNLRDSNADLAPAAESDTTPWQAYFETQAGTAGVDRANLTISQEKAGEASEIAKEALYELGLKKVSIRKVVRLAFQLENGPRPVKLRNVSIDTKADPSGYMDATFHVSAFSVTPAGGAPAGNSR